MSFLFANFLLIVLEYSDSFFFQFQSMPINLWKSELLIEEIYFRLVAICSFYLEALFPILN
jgi:hypothetical protein